MVTVWVREAEQRPLLRSLFRRVRVAAFVCSRVPPISPGSGLLLASELGAAMVQGCILPPVSRVEASTRALC